MEAAQQIIGLYRRHARAWATVRALPPGHQPMEAAWLDRFLSLVPKRRDVLDLGCGSGQPMAGYLIRQGCRLTGVDAAVEMIGFCKDTFPTHDWRVADMRTLALDRVFDGILAWDSFFHLCCDDQRRMFSRFRALAAPGAALMFTSGPAHGEVMGRFHGEPLYHASLDPAEYRALLADDGFSVISHVAEDPACGGHTVWLAQAR